MLLAHRADVNATAGRDHHTPISAASAQGNLPMVRLLLANGADPTIGGINIHAITTVRYGDGNPVDQALRHGHDEIARLLLSTIAQMDACQYCGVKGLYTRSNAHGKICDDCAYDQMATAAHDALRQEGPDARELMAMMERRQILRRLLLFNKENYEAFVAKYFR